MKRSMRLITKQSVEGQLRVDERAHEITFRSVKGGADGTEQRAYLCALKRGAGILIGMDRKTVMVVNEALSKRGVLAS